MGPNQTESFSKEKETIDKTNWKPTEWKKYLKMYNW